MSDAEGISNVEMVERRKHWRDRRNSNDRRNLQRLKQVEFDCRSGQPRRQSDVARTLAEGEIWWNKEQVKVE